MTCDSDEIPLSGGRTASSVVRVADTVRRPPAPNSEFVRRMLRDLRESGFDGVPEFLGTDGHGREMFGYIEGDVPADLSHYDDATLASAAGLIRAYHDHTADFLKLTGPPDTRDEVVCHNDLSPCNFVFRGGRPAAIIDFDAAAPGSRAQDLGYAAWLWLDLGASDYGASEQHRRLALFQSAYGDSAPALGDLVDAILARQATLIERATQIKDDATRAWATQCRGWTLENANALKGD